jgi:hypothetical protein
MVGPHDHLYPSPSQPEATERYYFAQRGNSGGFYLHFHKSDTDEPLMSSRSYNYEDAQKVVDDFNESAGLVPPVDDDYCEEE